MWRNERADREISQVNMSPNAWPAAMVEWSADRARDVTAPHSRAFVPGPMMVFKLC